MNKSLEKVHAELSELATHIEKSWNDERTLTEVYGWNCPPLTKYDLSQIPKSIAEKIAQAAPEDIDEDTEERIIAISPKIQLLKKHTIPQLFNNNSHQAINAFTATLNWIDSALAPLTSWQECNDNKILPPGLARSLRAIRTQLDQITPDKDDLAKRINLIKDATEAAESLPTDLQSLIEARKKIASFSDESIKLHGAIEKNKENADKRLKEINDKKEEAVKLVNQCEEAYRITTTKGLAAGFDQRATKLSNSMWVWVGGLILSLVTGAFLGTSRITTLSSALERPDQSAQIIITHIILSFLSIGAPLWFAWISTKQISQRFRLAEDYAFKASVAKAYEGYRKEAARIDEHFEARLFSSALTRLEEAPLRLVNDDNYHTPWQELISSPQFQDALDTLPDLKDKFIDIAKRGIESMTQDRRSQARRPDGKE